MPSPGQSSHCFTRLSSQRSLAMSGGSLGWCQLSHYIERFGHPRLRARHLPFAIGIAERDQWLGCLVQAMAEQAVDPTLAQRLAKSFSAPRTGFATRAAEDGTAGRGDAPATRCPPARPTSNPGLGFGHRGRLVVI